MKECLNLNEMTENKSFKLLKESLLLVRGGGLLICTGLLACPEGSVFEHW